MSHTPARTVPDPYLRLRHAVHSWNLDTYRQGLDELSHNERWSDLAVASISLITRNDNAMGSLHREVFLRTLLGRADWPGVGDRGHTTIEFTIANEALECLPLLYAAGFRIKEEGSWRDRMLDLMGRGKWPYPELFAPDILESEQARDRMVHDIFRKPSMEEGFLKKLVQLPLTEALLQQVTRGIAWMREEEHIPRSEEDIRAMSVLIEHGWIDLDAFDLLLESNPTYEQPLRHAMARAQEHLLRRDTAPAKTPGSRPLGRL